MPNLPTKKSQKSIKTGSLFQLGEHKLLCGDATNAKAINALIGTETVRAILTDPPYGISVVESKKDFCRLKVQKDIANDDIDSETDYAEFTKNWLLPALPHLSRKNSVYIFNSDKMIFALKDGMERSGVRFSQLLIWVKNHAVIGRKDYLPQHELIAFGWFGCHEFMKSQDKSVLFYPKPNKSPLHPTMKPVGLLRNLILNSSRVGDIVYDPFLGSGSTLIACQQIKRKCFACEIDPQYCLATIARFERLTGIKAKQII
jgi:site-specific DNA-methyltransferase (adenine-specific)